MLRYPYEVRSEPEYVDDIEPLTLPKEMIDVARHIATTMQSDFDPAALNDRERAAIVDPVKEKQRALPVPADRRGTSPTK